MNNISQPSGVVLATRGLGKQYPKGNWGLRDASVTLRSGRMIAILGPNGAGKSTLLHMLAGAIQPTKGLIEIASPSQRIGWSSQRTTIDWYLNVMQNVEIGGRMYGLSRRESREKALSLLSQFQLGDLTSNDVSMLSGGQQQRIQVARTLMSDPDIMLLDEPTASLDVESAEAVLGSIHERTRSGALALVSSHDLGLLERFCDEVLFVLDGRVITHQPMHTFLRQFTPTDTIRLSLDTEISPQILAALTPFKPITDSDDTNIIEVSVPENGALGDIVLALGQIACVLDAQRTSTSLRNVYLKLTEKKESAE